jgi:hypothetical protein
LLDGAHHFERKKQNATNYLKHELERKPDYAERKKYKPDQWEYKEHDQGNWPAHDEENTPKNQTQKRSHNKIILKTSMQSIYQNFDRLPNRYFAVRSSTGCSNRTIR